MTAQVDGKAFRAGEFNVGRTEDMTRGGGFGWSALRSKMIYLDFPLRIGAFDLRYRNPPDPVAQFNDESGGYQSVNGTITVSYFVWPEVRGTFAFEAEAITTGVTGRKVVTKGSFRFVFPF
jgi:hypothetical protein